MIALGLLLPFGSAPAQETLAAEPYVPNSPGLRGRLVMGAGDEGIPAILYGWERAFARWHPEVEWSTSSYQPLRNFQSGKSDLAAVFEPMAPGKLADYESTHGVRPVVLRPAAWALGIYVHALNPSPGLTLEWLESVYSSHFPEVRTWSELGLSEEWGRRPVLAFVSKEESDRISKWRYFDTFVLRQADWKKTVRRVEWERRVLENVGSELGGLAFERLHAGVPGTRLVAMGTVETAPVLPSAETCWSGQYPLTRIVHLYARVPAGPEGELMREFLRFIDSREGEDAVRRAGMFPKVRGR